MDINNGLIIQWGKASHITGNQADVTFPVSFSNTNYIVTFGSEHNTWSNDASYDEGVAAKYIGVVVLTRLARNVNFGITSTYISMGF